MDIRGTTVMVLGGGGMVGRAVCRELLDNHPRRIIVCSLYEAEARDAVRSLGEELQRVQHLTRQEDGSVELIPEWGNVFVRESLKHLTGAQAMQTPEGRSAIIEDTLEPMSATVARRFFLYQLVLKYRPDVIIDGMNTATGIAYNDIFSQARRVWHELQDMQQTQTESVERLLCSLYIPQLIRHVDVLYRAMVAVDTKAYLKLGTSGTGGMGWNIPYTHGEERPSSVLLSKSAVAGAHTLLLFLLARTPGVASLEHDEVVSKTPPATMEIKPTAMIGWRGIGYGDIMKRGKPVELETVRLENAIPIEPGATLKLEDSNFGQPSGRLLQTVFVDTGENGLFSTEEFIAITSPGQMEFVTPEEIARNVVDEVRGVNTGKDVINALNVTCMGPTYRAGFQRQRAITKLRRLEREHGVDSVAFENLGPPRLSKLLYEAYYLKRLFRDLREALSVPAPELVQRIFQLFQEDPDLLATPVSIGIPVLFEERGMLRLLRGRLVKTPPGGLREVRLDASSVEEWARAGWIDLRVENLEHWKQRLQALQDDCLSIPANESSSRYVRDREFWSDAPEAPWSIQPGEIAAWIFINEDKGERGRE